MRLLKKLVVFSFIILMFACKSDDEGNQFVLNYENLAGLYELVSFIGSTETMIDVGGVLLPAVITVEGDTFQVDAMFNQNGTYSITGEYRIVTTVTVGGQSVTDPEIINVDDAGTFIINANEQTITIMSNNQDEIDGTFDVTLFNENEIRLFQEETITIDGITSDTILEMRFIRQ